MATDRTFRKVQALIHKTKTEEDLANLCKMREGITVYKNIATGTYTIKTCTKDAILSLTREESFIGAVIRTAFFVAGGF